MCASGAGINNPYFILTPVRLLVDKRWNMTEQGEMDRVGTALSYTRVNDGAMEMTTGHPTTCQCDQQQSQADGNAHRLRHPQPSVACNCRIGQSEAMTSTPCDGDRGDEASHAFSASVEDTFILDSGYNVNWMTPLN